MHCIDSAFKKSPTIFAPYSQQFSIYAIERYVQTLDMRTTVAERKLA